MLGALTTLLLLLTPLPATPAEAAVRGARNGARPALTGGASRGTGSPRARPAGGGSSGLAELARTGRWAAILEIAQRREAQLPVTGIQALIAAEAALRLGEPVIRQHYLEAALDHAAAGPVARVELAGMLVQQRPERCVELLLPLLGHAPSGELRRGAAGLAGEAVRAGIPETLRPRLGRELRHLPRSSRRSLEVALALTGNHRRRDLQKVLQADRTDLADLHAAEALLGLGPATAKEQWLVARSLYRHARYEEALGLVRELTQARRHGVVLWKARYLRGRCVFRLERWREAASWYRKAQAAASRREDRASLLVHEARALELGGDLDGAAARARKAVATRPTDDRRLFLGRLELARGHRRKAAQVFSTLRRTTARDRGLLLQAIDANARGDAAAAAGYLARVRGRVWRGPSLILAAAAALEQGAAEEASSFLERASREHPHGFWALQALRLARQLPATQRQRWSARLHAELSAKPPRTRSTVLRFACLATGPGDRAALREAASTFLGLQGDTVPMAWRNPMARKLWEAGLAGSAARWIPRGFPGVTPFETAWSARQLLSAGSPSWSIRLADASLRRLGAGLPADIIPVPVQRSLFPLPFPAPVTGAAEGHGLPWTVLAAVAREESRWNPRALSAVGARGLTQMMPETARRVALQLQRTPPSPNDLFRPSVGLDLGAAELARLLRIFENRGAPAIAAYNAGEPQARLWLRQAGPRSTEAWYVAAIGFSATRTYTSEVLWAEQAYSEIWNEISGTGGHVSRSPRPEGASPAAREWSRRDATSPHRSTFRSPR